MSACAGSRSVRQKAWRAEIVQPGVQTPGIGLRTAVFLLVLVESRGDDIAIGASVGECRPFGAPSK